MIVNYYNYRRTPRQLSHSSTNRRRHVQLDGQTDRQSETDKQIDSYVQKQTHCDRQTLSDRQLDRV